MLTAQPGLIACSGKECVEDTSVVSVSFTIEDWTYLLYGAPAQYVHLPNVNNPPNHKSRMPTNSNLPSVHKRVQRAVGFFLSFLALVLLVLHKKIRIIRKQTIRLPALELPNKIRSIHRPNKNLDAVVVQGFNLTLCKKYS